jgi:hypothetical protein
MTERNFSRDERDLLLAAKGVGPKVIERLEPLSVTLRQPAEQDIESISAAASALIRSTCWKNGPQARAAIASAIASTRSAVLSNAPQRSEGNRDAQ